MIELIFAESAPDVDLPAVSFVVEEHPRKDF